VKTIGKFDVEVSCQRINVNAAMKRSLGSQVHDKTDLTAPLSTINIIWLRYQEKNKGILDPALTCGRLSAQDTITNYQNE
jgi:hypothetical protein